MFGSIKFLLCREGGRQPGCRAHSSPLTLLVRWEDVERRLSPRAAANDKGLGNSLEIQGGESCCKETSCLPLLSLRLGEKKKRKAADQSVINTVILVNASSFCLVFEVELSDELMNTSVTFGLR